MLKKEYAIYLGLATEFIGLMVGFILFGHWLDDRFALGGLGVVAGTFAALIGWGAHFIFVARRLSREGASEK